MFNSCTLLNTFFDTSSATFEVPTPGDMVRPRMDVEFTSKLENDLATVFEKIKLCREMLLESPGIEEDDALAEVIGFLEACRDRMADVIEAGTQGDDTHFPLISPPAPLHTHPHNTTSFYRTIK